MAAGLETRTRHAQPRHLDGLAPPAAPAFVFADGHGLVVEAGSGADAVGRVLRGVGAALLVELVCLVVAALQGDESFEAHLDFLGRPTWSRWRRGETSLLAPEDRRDCTWWQAKRFIFQGFYSSFTCLSSGHQSLLLCRRQSPETDARMTHNLSRQNRVFQVTLTVTVS